LTLPTIVTVDDDHDYFDTTMKTLKTTMGLEIVKMKLKMTINKALIDYVIALATLVLRSLTITTSKSVPCDSTSTPFWVACCVRGSWDFQALGPTPTSTLKVSLYY